MHDLQGIKPIVSVARKYSEDGSSSHVIGYVSDTSAKDNRGLAASSTEIHGKNSTDNHVELKGILRDGQPYNCAFPRLHDGDKVDASVGDPLLGNELKSKWWVKVRMQMENEEVGYQLSKGQRRTVEYKRVFKREIQALL